MTFQITTKDGKRFTVEAEGYGQAASAAAQKIYRRKTLTAQRTTGSHNMSGYFRAYESVRGNGLNGVGEAFHITEN